ncbi:hypothetical protein D3C72_1618660 [compost metagenome]
MRHRSPNTVPNRSGPAQMSSTSAGTPALASFRRSASAASGRRPARMAAGAWAKKTLPIAAPISVIGADTIRSAKAKWPTTAAPNNAEKISGTRCMPATLNMAVQVEYSGKSL